MAYYNGGESGCGNRLLYSAFMVNCAHPQHFMNEFHGNGYLKSWIGGIRANASLKSHAELDESTVLDTGDKCLLASGYAELFTLLPSIKVVGGCCGTDYGHLEEICKLLEGGLVL